MKNFIAGALCAVLLSTIVLAAYLGLGFMETRADVAPSAWEAGLITSFLHASVHRQADPVPNPLPDSDATLIAGGKLYMNDCVGCHGAPGQPASTFGASFYPQVPQFPQVGSQYSQAELFWVAKHGIRLSGMFPKTYYPDADLWSLATFISHIRNLPPAVVKAIEEPSPN
jgi:mono/diheme cytochrome c family protein